MTFYGITNHVKPGMSINLNIREKPLLIQIQQYFGGIGSIYTYLENKVIQFKGDAARRPFRLFHLISAGGIIPHFNSYFF